MRTIYRDIDALAASGVPVYADRGAKGRYRLLDGYRVRLNGLSQSEAEALFLTGLPGPAAAFGLDAAMIAAENKLLPALPANLRESRTDAGAFSISTRRAGSARRNNQGTCAPSPARPCAGH